MKRRHSRQELVERHRAEQELGEETEAGGQLIDLADSTIPLTNAGEDGTGPLVATQSMGANAGELRNRMADHSGWDRADDEPQHTSSQSHAEDADPYEIYDDEAVQGMMGYVASFEMSSQYDMLLGAWLPENEEQQSTGNFWDLF